MLRRESVVAVLVLIFRCQPRKQVGSAILGVEFTCRNRNVWVVEVAATAVENTHAACCTNRVLRRARLRSVF